MKIDFISEFYQKKSENFSILVLGDSTIAFGLNPIKLKSAISLALPGATMLTARTEFLRYLERRKAPRCLLISTASIVEYYHSYFWKMYIPSDMYSDAEISRIYSDSIKRNIFPSSEFSPFSFQLRWFYYKNLYYSTKKEQSLKSFFNIPIDKKYFFSEKRPFSKFKKNIQSSNGFMENDQAGKDGLFTLRNTYLLEEFNKIESDDQYLMEILQIANKHNVKIFFLEMPILDQGDKRVNSFHAKHMAHIQGIFSNHPNAKIIKSQFPNNAEYFRDISHLNMKGANAFTNYISEYLGTDCI